MSTSSCTVLGEAGIEGSYVMCVMEGACLQLFLEGVVFASGVEMEQHLPSPEEERRERLYIMLTQSSTELPTCRPCLTPPPQPPALQTDPCTLPADCH